MPEVCRFLGIVIRFYYDDHLPPHFHAIYNEFEAQIAIGSHTIVEGRLPNRVLGLVQEWADLHRDELQNCWQQHLVAKHAAGSTPSRRSRIPNLEPFPLSLLNDFLYCPRRAALKSIEGLRGENAHTVLGSLAHERADLPGYEVAKGVKLLRALPVWSERLGLNGKCDIVEVVEIETTSTNDRSKMTNYKSVCPVEYKKGKRRRFDNDDAQLCAQALCLEEMFGRKVERGAIFHAASKRRREVEFTEGLRQLTLEAIEHMRALFDAGETPAAVYKEACEECSLFEICLPRMTCQPDRLKTAARHLFDS